MMHEFLSKVNAQTGLAAGGNRGEPATAAARV